MFCDAKVEVELVRPSLPSDDDVHEDHEVDEVREVNVPSESREP